MPQDKTTRSIVFIQPNFENWKKIKSKG